LPTNAENKQQFQKIVKYHKSAEFSPSFSFKSLANCTAVILSKFY